ARVERSPVHGAGHAGGRAADDVHSIKQTHGNTSGGFGGQRHTSGAPGSKRNVVVLPRRGRPRPFRAGGVGGGSRPRVSPSAPLGRAHLDVARVGGVVVPGASIRVAGSARVSGL